MNTLLKFTKRRFEKKNVNYRRWIPYELQLFYLENLEVRLVVLNVVDSCQNV